MRTSPNFETHRPFAAFLAIAAVLAPAVARAEALPSYAIAAGETIHGTISSVAGKYDVYVRDDRGFVDHVALHDGTVINPTGLTLGSGQTVTITGHNGGTVFRADEIDTPYQSVPAYVYSGNAYAPYDRPYGYGYPYWYGNPYGFGYPYGYGYLGYPYGFSIGLRFGGYPYHHGFYGHGFYGHGLFGRRHDGSTRGYSAHRGYEHANRR